MSTNEEFDRADWLRHQQLTSNRLKHIVRVLKNRFTNLSAIEVVEIASTILEGLQIADAASQGAAAAARKAADAAEAAKEQRDEEV